MSIDMKKKGFVFDIAVRFKWELRSKVRMDLYSDDIETMYRGIKMYW